MPLFKVTKSLKHNQVLFEQNTIHEFSNSDEITSLVNDGVLIAIPESKEKELKDLSIKLDDKPLSKIQKESKIEDIRALCSKCKTRVDVIAAETFFYKSPTSEFFSKQETCAKCNNKIISRATEAEKKKIESGLIQLKKV